MSAKMYFVMYPGVKNTINKQTNNDVLATNGRGTVLLNVLEGCVGRQRLGKLLPCLWTELVASKTAKKEAGRQCQQKMNVHFVNNPA